MLVAIGKVLAFRGRWCGEAQSFQVCLVAFKVTASPRHSHFPMILAQPVILNTSSNCIDAENEVLVSDKLVGHGLYYLGFRPLLS